jgi:hypothetical protein
MQPIDEPPPHLRNGGTDGTGEGLADASGTDDTARTRKRVPQPPAGPPPQLRTSLKPKSAAATKPKSSMVLEPFEKRPRPSAAASED